MARSLIGIDDFVAGLGAVFRAASNPEGITDFCERVRVSDASLDPFVVYSDACYTRNLVYRDATFEVIVICWRPGQRTPVHSHNGQLGWVIPQRGTLRVVDYVWLGCDLPANQKVVGVDCLAGSTGVRLERTAESYACEGSPTLTTDRSRTIHQIANEAEVSVSVHVYSKPIDSCVAFDLNRARCARHDLAYFSRRGEVGRA